MSTLKIIAHSSTCFFSIYIRKKKPPTSMQNHIILQSLFFIYMYYYYITKLRTLILIPFLCTLKANCKTSLFSTLLIARKVVDQVPYRYPSIHTRLYLLNKLMNWLSSIQNYVFGVSTSNHMKSWRFIITSSSLSFFFFFFFPYAPPTKTPEAWLLMSIIHSKRLQSPRLIYMFFPLVLSLLSY